jgi:hypothetical protein
LDGCYHSNRQSQFPIIPCKHNPNPNPKSNLVPNSIQNSDLYTLTLTLTLTLGYGDKEIYWIAATIVKDNFSFEPYLAGSYGDCGEIIHYDPLATLSNTPNIANNMTPERMNNIILRANPSIMPNIIPIVPYFINCQYLSEGIDYIGKNLQTKISNPILISKDTKMFNMGKKDQQSAGRCGACEAMGCELISSKLTSDIIRYQKFLLANTRKKMFWLKIRRFFDKPK